MIERDAWPRILPFAVYMLFIVAADLLGRLGLDAATLRWLYPIKVGLVLALLLYFRHRYTELAWRRPGAAPLTLSVVVGVAVLLLWINLNAGWMQLGSSDGFDPRRDGALDWSLVVLRVAGAALVVPVMEELFWRSFLLRWVESPRFLSVDPARVRGVAFAVTAALFGVEHSWWLAGIVAGAAYAWLYMRTRQLWLAILAHAVTNALLGGWIISTGNWTYW